MYILNQESTDKTRGSHRNFFACFYGQNQLLSFAMGGLLLWGQKKKKKNQEFLALPLVQNCNHKWKYSFVNFYDRVGFVKSLKKNGKRREPKYIRHCARILKIISSFAVDDIFSIL